MRQFVSYIFFKAKFSLMRILLLQFEQRHNNKNSTQSLYGTPLVFSKTQMITDLHKTYLGVKLTMVSNMSWNISISGAIF